MTTLAAIPTEPAWQLSPLQSRLWQRHGADCGPYRAGVTVELTGRLDRARLADALRTVVARHEILRTRFCTVAGLQLAVQVIDAPAAAAIEIGDRSSPTPAAAGRSAVDLAAGPVLRAELVRCDDERHELALSLPALCADHGTLRLLVEQLARAYGDDAHAEAEPLQYADVGEWQREVLDGAAPEHWLRFWQEHAPDALTETRVPFASDDAAAVFAPARRDVATAPGLADRLARLARTQGTTAADVLLACWVALLGRLVGEPDAIVGLVADGRRQPELESVLGPLARVVPVGCDVDGRRSFSSLLADVAGQVRIVTEVQEAFGWPSARGHLPLAFAWTRVHADTTARGVRFVTTRADACIEPFLLKLTARDDPDGCTLALDYDAGSLAPAAVDAFGRSLGALLDGLDDVLDLPLARLPLLSAADRERLVVEFNRTAVPHLTQVGFADLFERAARRHPDATAATCRAETLDYDALEERANALAHRLRRHGVGTDVRVAVALPRSLDLVVGLLAVAKAGGAFVPIDVSDPEERKLGIMRDAAPAVLIGHAEQLAALGAAAPVAIDPARDAAALALEPTTPPARTTAGEDLAYVMYTSGSTGRPKGVMVCQRGLANYLAWARDYYDVASGWGAPVHSSIGFDLTITSLFAPLVAGRTVHLLPDDGAVDALARTLAETPGASFVKITPAHLDLLARLLPAPSAAGATRALVVGGDALRAERLAFWRRHAPEVRIVNEYGPTETVVGCMVHDRPAAELEHGAVPIGRPIANTRIYVVDETLAPQPIGVAGEICIGGVGVARGYLNGPELTAERFVPDPFTTEPGARLYRTGDLGRFMPDGTLDFLGRTDGQVKIRGHRIELGEVEATLGQHPAVREAVVVARPDATSEKRLVAYVTGDATGAELRAFARRTLPEAMVPSVVVVLDALPLTTNGKVDRAALPPPAAGPRDPNRVPLAPRDGVELRLVEIWEACLETAPIGVLDDFFDLGGHSLLAVQLVFAIEQAFGTAPPLTALFEAPTIEALAARLRGDAPAPDEPCVVPMQRHGSAPPLFLVHPAGGHALCYLELARALGAERPVYGVQAVGLDGRDTPHTHVAEMAAHYVGALRRVQPDGPYLLGGSSMGGVIAVEMAAQLRRAGATVDRVVLLDTVAPTPAEGPPDLDEVRRWVHLARVLAEFYGRPLVLDVDALAGLSPEAQWDHVVARAREAGLVPPAMGAEPVRRFVEVHRSNEAALRAYVPTPCAVPLALFRARELQAELNRSAAGHETDPTLGWAALAAGTLEVHEVPGNHITMLARPHVETLAALLRQCLARGDASTDAGTVRAPEEAACPA